MIFEGTSTVKLNNNKLDFRFSSVKATPKSTTFLKRQSIRIIGERRKSLGHVSILVTLRHWLLPLRSTALGINEPHISCRFLRYISILLELFIVHGC